MTNVVKELLDTYLSGEMTIVDFVEALRKSGLSEQEVSDLLWEEGCAI